MRRSANPATLVICAELPRQFQPAAVEAWVRGCRRRRTPVTWSAGIESLAAAAEALRHGNDRADLALTLSSAWLDSRQTLRRMIAAARQAVPSLEAAVLRGPRPLAHQSLLAEEGIRVVLVQTFGDAARGSRRPAPAGWACRNPAWGLWEVRIAPPPAPGLVGLLTQWGSMPRPKAGTLQALHAGDTVAGTSDGATSGRLERWLAWAERRQAAGQAVVAPLADLPARLANGGQPPQTGSILKAA